MSDPLAIYPVVVNGDIPLLVDAVHQLPQVILYAIAIVLNFGIMVDFFADQFVRLLLSFQCGKAP